MVKDAGAVEASDGVYATIKVSGSAIPSGHIQVRPCHPSAPQAIETFRLAERLVLQILATEKVHPGIQHLRAEVSALCAHGLARPPTLVLHIEHLDGSKVVGTVMPADCVNKGEREETDAQVIGLLAESLAFRSIARRGWCGRLAEEIQNASEEAAVTVQEDATVAVARRLCAACQKPLQQAPGLLHQSVAGCLENHATDVYVDHGLCRNVVLRNPLALLLMGLVLDPELFPLQHKAPPALVHITVDVFLRLLQLRAGIRAFLLDLPCVAVRLHLGPLFVVTDPVVLRLLLRDKLLPDACFLVFKCLPLLLELRGVVIELTLRLFDPLLEGFANVAHHGAELVLRGQADGCPALHQWSRRQCAARSGARVRAGGRSTRACGETQRDAAGARSGPHHTGGGEGGAAIRVATAETAETAAAKASGIVEWGARRHSERGSGIHRGPGNGRHARILEREARRATTGGRSRPHRSPDC
mmetsp:Transcript_52421/g.152565  ORF Transcript_52421/g.152565 Transcript_52421/m.152565 type:complete len:473 (-) Transcript_52421:17-1435(-)